MFSFETVAEDLFESIKRRHRQTVGRSKTLRYAPMRLTMPEFREWLRGRSIKRAGELWICEETGVALSHKDARGPQFRLTIDHRDPMNLGGLTELSNLAIVSKAINDEKKSLTQKGWADYKEFKKSLCKEDRECVERQMRAAPSVAKYARKKARAAVMAGTGRGW